ncbi:hypothetical protein AMTRI_Chr02g263850 [Amborella trichopoda]
MATDERKVALVIGGTGMVGLTLVEGLSDPNSSSTASSWKIYAVARKPKPSYFPTIPCHYIECDVLDTQLKLSGLSDVTHVFWVVLHLREREEDNCKENSLMLRNVLEVLLTHAPKLQHICLQTGTKQYMGPIFDPVYGSKVTPHEAPFKEDSPRHPFPMFYYDLEDILIEFSNKKQGLLTWSVHRSSIDHGASTRSLHNGLLTLLVYALICKHEGMAFRFPGCKYSWEHFFDASDADLLAEQQIWAATTEKAKNQAFNCSNGDVFTWKSMWKAVANLVGVEYVPFNGEGFDLPMAMKDKAQVWDAIVIENGLFETKLEEITCFEVFQAVLNFGFQHVCSMNKSKEYGFLGFRDTFKSVERWVFKLRELKIIPK